MKIGIGALTWIFIWASIVNIGMDELMKTPLRHTIDWELGIISMYAMVLAYVLIKKFI